MCARIGALQLSIAEGPLRPLTFFGPRFDGLTEQNDGFLSTGELRGSFVLDIDHDGPCRVRLVGTTDPLLPGWVARHLVGKIGTEVRRQSHDDAPLVRLRLRALAQYELDVAFDGNRRAFGLDGDIRDGAMSGMFDFELPTDVRECTVTLGDVWADFEVVRLIVGGDASPFRIDWNRSDRCRPHDHGVAATGASPRIVFVREKPDLDPQRIGRARLEVVIR
ncbi:MAG: hypothetical protein H6834_18080 [Planctomycetes bacterium]|nr:hypothetical protein [Planctomycetota bacterium]